MSRKYRATETNPAQKPLKRGQERKCNWLCVNCNSSGSMPKHYPDCTKPEVYAIPPTAEVPKKNAPRRKWDIFKKQFLYSKLGGWWFYSEYSWFSKNNK